MRKLSIPFIHYLLLLDLDDAIIANGVCFTNSVTYGTSAHVFTLSNYMTFTDENLDFEEEVTMSCFPSLNTTKSFLYTQFCRFTDAMWYCWYWMAMP
jgi:hypothetical protein